MNKYVFMIGEKECLERVEIMANNEEEAIDVMMRKKKEKNNFPIVRKFYKDCLFAVDEA